MLLFFALFLVAIVGLFEWNYPKWVRSATQFRWLELAMFGLLTCIGIGILLRTSLDSLTSTIFLSPFIAVSLWKLIDVSYQSGKILHTLGLVLLCIFLGTLLCLPLLSLNLHQNLYIEYLLDWARPVPPPDSIHPEAHRVIHV